MLGAWEEHAWGLRAFVFRAFLLFKSLLAKEEGRDISTDEKETPSRVALKGRF